MGDPETEVVIPRLKSDILDLFEGVATNTLSERDIQFTDKSAATVMMVSGGYPEAYEKGKSIYGLNTIRENIEDLPPLGNSYPALLQAYELSGKITERFQANA